MATDLGNSPSLQNARSESGESDEWESGSIETSHVSDHPAPVIFAGVSSPGRHKVHKHENPSAGRQIIKNNRYKRRTSFGPITKKTSKRSHLENVATSSVSTASEKDTNKSPTPTGEFLDPTPVPLARRPSISSRSGHLKVVPSKAEIERISRQSAELRNQVAELEAALHHSRSRESVLTHSVDSMKKQLMQKDQQLEEKYTLLSTLEHVSNDFSTKEVASIKEHRQTKYNFCTLMGATMNELVQSNEDAEMADDSHMKTDESSKHIDSEMRIPKPIEMTKSTLSSSKVTSRSETLRRTRSVPPLQSKSVDRESEDLRNRLRETEELLENLSGTNGFAAQVIKRNSELERRCDELEGNRDAQLRDIYEILHQTRVEKSETDLMMEQYKIENENCRQEVANLHAELLRLHERAKKYKEVSIEVVELKAALLDAKEAFAKVSADHKRQAAEWEAEKAHFIRDVELHRRLSSAKSGEGIVDNSLRQRNVDLEELLMKTKNECAMRLQACESESKHLKTTLQQLKRDFEVEKQSKENAEEKVAELERLVSDYQSQLKKSAEEIIDSRKVTAELSTKAAEIDELRKHLKLEKDKNDMQSNQIRKHIEAIKESNARFVELIERNTILDKLLQKVQKEKEKIVSENMKTNEKLYNQFDAYRQKIDSQTVEISNLKRQLTGQLEEMKDAKDSFEIDKQRELRLLRDELMSQKLAIQKTHDQEIAKLRECHENELDKLRQDRDGKIDIVSQRYETLLSDMKSVHEKRVRDLQVNLENELRKSKEDFQELLNDMKKNASDRLQKERNSYQNELQLLTKTYHENLQTHLKRKTEEIEKLQRSFDEQNALNERNLLVAERKLEDAKLQSAQIATRKLKDAEDSFACQLNEEKEKYREMLRNAENQFHKALKEKEDTHQQSIQVVERKLIVMTEKLNASIEENKEKQNLMKEREHQLMVARQEITKMNEQFETEKKNIVDTYQTDKDQLKREINKLNQNYQNLENHSNNDNLIDKLNDQIQTLQLTNSELEKRLMTEIESYKGQLQARDERIISLQTTNQHTSSILKRNSQLEEAHLKEKSELENEVQRHSHKMFELESKFLKVNERLREVENDNGELQANLNEKKNIIERLTAKTNKLNLTLKEFKDEKFRIEELEALVEELQRRVSSREQQVNDEPQVIARYRQTLRDLNIQLNESQKKANHLEIEIEKFKKVSEEMSNLSLERQLLKSQLESQEHTIQLVRERADKKQEIIDDLKSQLVVLANESAPSKTTPPEVEEKVVELTRRCQQLSDLQQSFEQDKRALECRMELDRQLYTQTVDQKDRQLQQLLETNQRAEKLFTRNAELEAKILTLLAQLDTAHLNAKRQNVSTTEETTTVTTETREGVEKTRHMQSELNALRSELSQRDGEVRLLESRMRDLKASHHQEITDLKNKFRITSFQQSLHESNSDDHDLLDQLVQKTAQLTKEVARLRKERDEQILILRSENESLKAAATPGASSIEGRDHFYYMESQIESLQLERDSLKTRIKELLETHRSNSSLETNEMQNLRSQVKELQNTIDRLSEIVADQRRTLDVMNRHADNALKQNKTLKDLTTQLTLEDEGLFENIIRRNIELEAMILELQKDNNTHYEYSPRIRSSQKVMTSHELHTKNEIDDALTSIQNKLAQVHADVSELEAANANRNHSNSEQLTTDNSENKQKEGDCSAVTPKATFISTPSTTAGNSRASPGSALSSGQGPEPTFYLSSTIDDESERCDDEQQVSLYHPQISLYKTLRSSKLYAEMSIIPEDVQIDIEDDESFKQKLRAKRPRTRASFPMTNKDKRKTGNE